MKRLTGKLALFSALAVASATNVAAQGAPKAPAVDMSQVRSATFKSCDTTKYPASEVQQTREGWVNVRVTVGTDGRVKDPEVISAFGRGSFEEAALAGVASCVFEPATVNGQPVETKNIVVPMYFRISKMEPGANASMAKRLRDISKMIDAGQLDAAWASLDEAEEKSTLLYEMAHIMLRRAIITAARGNGDLAIAYLRQMEYVRNYLTSEEMQKVQRFRLRLELQAGQFKEALMTEGKVRDLGKFDGDDSLVAGLNQMRQATAEKPIWGLKGSIPANCPDHICGKEPVWRYRPLHRTVSLSDVTGVLHQVEGRCPGRTFKADAKPNVTWTIPKSWGDCVIQVSGAPGASFTLIDETIPVTQ